MKSLSILSTTTLCFLFTFIHCCPTHRSFDFSDCVFYITPTDETCFNFQFNQCSWDICVDQQIINNVSTCVSYQTQYDSDWSYCTRYCCGTTDNIPQTYSGLDECQTAINNYVKIVAIIVGSIIGGILLILLIVWLVCRNKTGIQECGVGCCRVMEQVCKYDWCPKKHRHGQERRVTEIECNYQQIK